jgi:hypothetical protein
MINFSNSVACDESIAENNMDIIDKEQFIRDFLNDFDLMKNPEAFNKYSSFRVRKGLCQEYSNRMDSEYIMDTFLPHFDIKVNPISQPIGHAKMVSEWPAGLLCHSSTVRYDNEVENYKEYKEYPEKKYFPKIDFIWFCVDNQWVLADIQFSIGWHRCVSISLGSYGDYEDW